MGRSNGGFARTRAGVRVAIVAVLAIAALCAAVSLGLGMAYATPEGDGGSSSAAASGGGEGGSVGTGGADGSGGADGTQQANDAGTSGEAGANGGIAPASLDEIPDEVLKRLANEQGIYPGTKTTNDNGQEVWTVYDAGSEGAAAVKATVTLPQGSHAWEKSYLYIRRVNVDEGYYPNADVIAAKVGETNDVQCYAVHWVELYQEDDGTWNYDLDTDSVLGEEDDAPKAQVAIEYLKEDAYLKGHQAERKLQVYNSREKDGTALEENATPTSVSANTDAYTGFTFETNRGGPYVFVSKKLFEGYVRSITTSKITDGTAPFDTDDAAGNDSAESNGVVRSYDQIKYDMTINFGARSNRTTATEATIGFETTLDADITEATFDLSQMQWLEDRTIEYLDKDGQVLYAQDEDGNLRDVSGAVVSINDIATGSNQGEDSYSTRIASQRLRGSYPVAAEQNLLSGNRTATAAIQVLGAHNASAIKPTFRARFEGNEDNYGSENQGEGTDVTLAEIVTDNKVTPDPVTVSAAARFNLELAKNSNVSYKGWFDSSTGKEVNASNSDAYTVGNASVSGAQLYELLEQLADLEKNRDRANPEEFTDNEGACSAYLQGASLADYAAAFKNIRYGRLTGYGTTLQIYNSGKGFKGVSLPQGDISFDLALDTLVKEVGADENAPGEQNSQYYSQLWEYNENVSADTGNQGKNLYWADLGSTKYAAWAAPYNTGGGEAACYNGGSWNLGDSGAYHFTVSGYDLNFQLSGVQFPTHRAGNGTATSGYNDYIGSFSAGYVQVLNVFPRHQSKTLNLSTQITVKNLTASTTDGQGIAPDPGDGTGYAHETNTGDNAVTDSIPLYAPGGMTKANAFCDAKTFDDERSNFTSNDRFLGTYFWDTSYDCSAFAGQRITLVGAARINAGDYRIKHMNMLQLFDSKVLSISKGKTPYVMSGTTGYTQGATTILYAADPDYRQGYDTNVESVMSYMSTVREEDLIYFTSLKDLEDAGYTCVGVMAELRDWDISAEGGYSTALKIAMDVSDSEDNLANTVGTVNTVRIWTNANDMKVADGNGGTKYVSWADGSNNPAEEKNSVLGYTKVGTGGVEHYSGEVANGSAYEKTEYENGQFKLGSNTGGYVYGSSLLILSYKSEVHIAVDNGGTAAQRTFDMDKGESTVAYHLSGIIAKPGDSIGDPQSKMTNLTIPVKLDTKPAAGQTEQRIAVSDNSYAMVPASERMVLVDTKGTALETQSLDIGSDPDHPTEVRYRFKDENTGELTGPTYVVQVYAQRDSNGGQVTFEVKGVTLGVAVPDITFNAFIEPQAVSNGDAIEATASIGGTDDVRAYSETEGNQDKVSIGIVKLAGTRLVKSVDKRYIELDGTFAYTVRYTNTGGDPVSVYLYDLVPNTDDIRGSDFSGNVVLREVVAQLAGNEEFTATIDFYYSKAPYGDLYAEVSKFGDDGSGRDVEAIKKMLEDEDGPFKPLGTIDGTTQNELKPSKYITGNFTDPTTGEVDTEKLSEEMSKVTGIYAVVSNLKGGSSLEIKMTGQAHGNETGDLYRNLANSWLGGADEPLTSNLVETSVLSRAINGVVWEDTDLDGVRDAGEPLIRGVTCTLFKLDEDAQSATQGQYVPCTTDVTGGKIGPVATGEDGSYSFEKLASGKYIVAFSGDGLSAYKGATTYRVNGEDDAASNDAVALRRTSSVLDTEAQALGGVGSDYAYAIAYDLTESGGDATTYTAEAAPLHSIDDIVGSNITLTNGVELYANLDCGLVKDAGFELPETGGAGVPWLYLAGGALLMGGAGGLAIYQRKRTACAAGAVKGKVR